MTEKLTYEEWEKYTIETTWTLTEEEIESWKNKYYSGLNTYDEFKQILKEEYEQYCKEND
jgi:hypothetical protein